MGNKASKSKAKSETNITNVVVNKTDLEFFNQTINTNITEKTTKAASSCVSDVSGKQEISLKDIKVGGNLTINDVEQSVQIDVNFSCINTTNIVNDVQGDMLTQMMGQLDSISDSGLQSEIMNKLAASASNSGLQIGSGGTNSDVESTTNVNNEITNETKVNVRNVVENTVKNVFNEESMNECISRVSGNQIFGLKRIDVEGDLTLNDLTQRAVISVFANCVSEQNFGTQVVNKLANKAGMEVKAENKTTTDTKTTTEAESKSTQSGILPDFGDKKKKLIPIVGGAVVLSSLVSVGAVVIMSM